ncbi:MAG TPA: hydroxymethylglutaryl-CoA lyase [Bacteroidia bacterium]|nr:hydroxymethylglutaryl-CoA lyase [Bacteroidia bacterium]HNP98947.1 hydroxymethylglutaryl-CoA lyase [Bacteroidia bacterium]
MKTIKLVECPRDAMQGWNAFIPTQQKIKYLNSLLKVGFDTLDFGSFVSPKAIPQLKDTTEVLSGLTLSNTSTKLLSIVANLRGAEQAASFEEITYLGFPFSVSEEFQKRNTNSTIEESLERVEEIQRLCLQKKKVLVIYISMGFGNPYGEEWNAEIVIKWVKRLAEMGTQIIALSDTVGVSNPQNIKTLFQALIPEIPQVEFGAHLHSHPLTWMEKVEAAFMSGCRRFDSALKGIGGCPMANDALVGNLATENVVAYFKGQEDLGLDDSAFRESMILASEIFH